MKARPTSCVRRLPRWLHLDRGYKGGPLPGLEDEDSALPVLGVSNGDNVAPPSYLDTSL